MFEQKNIKYKVPDLSFIFKSIKLWLISSLLLLLFSSLVISHFSVGSDKIAYISSAISFISAIFAGAGAVSGRDRGALPSSFFISLLLIIVLLSIGYLIDSNALSSDGIISVTSFTFAGCFLGGIIIPGLMIKRLNNKKSKNRFKRS